MSAPHPVLDDLADLAAIEHALCVDYLLLHYALRTVGSLSAAADEAMSMAQNAEMHHLARANRALVKAGRPPVLGRVAQVVGASGTPRPVATISAQRFHAFPEPEQDVAAAVDQRYARLREAVDASPGDLDPEALEKLTFLLDTVGSHAERMDALAASLADVDLARLLADLRTAPSTPNERELFDLSNGYYRVIVDALRAGLGHTDLLVDVATATMGGLDQINGELVAARLVPAFDLGA